MEKIIMNYQDNKCGYSQSYLFNLEDYNDENTVINENKNGEEVIEYTITNTRNGYVFGDNELEKGDIKNSITVMQEYRFDQDGNHMYYKISDEDGNLLGSFSLDIQPI